MTKSTKLATHLGPHKYKKFVFKSGYSVHKCVFPSCCHFIDSRLLAGREAICWRCGDIFVVKEKHLYLWKLHCDECTKRRLASAVEFRELIENEG